MGAFSGGQPRTVIEKRGDILSPSREPPSTQSAYSGQDHQSRQFLLSVAGIVPSPLPGVSFLWRGGHTRHRAGRIGGVSRYEPGGSRIITSVPRLHIMMHIGDVAIYFVTCILQFVSHVLRALDQQCLGGYRVRLWVESVWVSAVSTRRQSVVSVPQRCAQRGPHCFVLQNAAS